MAIQGFEPITDNCKVTLPKAISAKLGEYFGFNEVTSSKLPDPINFVHTWEAGKFVTVEFNWTCVVVSQILNWGEFTIVITGIGWTVITVWFDFLQPEAAIVSSNI